MRDAALHDLNQLEGATTFCTYDSRLPAPSLAHQSIAMTGDDGWSLWRQCILEADVVLPIAPETDGALLKITQAINRHERVLLGSSAQAVAIAGSKLATFETLQSVGINVVPTCDASIFSPYEYEQWVVKPDDGVGCEDTRLFSCSEDFKTWLEGIQPGHYVAQPYIQGVAASLSLLCREGQAWLLSCNRQKVSVRSGQFFYFGSVVNGVKAYWDDFEQLGQLVARAMPSLSGYVGVDVMIHDESISVLEINPRLTTSYVGLHKAMGYNPAELLLDLLYNSRFSSNEFHMPVIQRNEVDVSLND
jgi:predicted ATP-grasp superfamily ATP-dependent carboligase